MGIKSNQIYVNLAVKDLNKSMEFFTRVGFEFNRQFTNESSACLVIGENIFAMLQTEESFQAFTGKELVDASRSAEMILALSAGSRGEVDEIVSRALASGGRKSSDPIDHGFMYVWGFEDVDGHLWEVLYMDMNALSFGRTAV